MYLARIREATNRLYNIRIGWDSDVNNVYPCRAIGDISRFTLNSDSLRPSWCRYFTEARRFCRFYQREDFKSPVTRCVKIGAIHTAYFNVGVVAGEMNLRHRFKGRFRREIRGCRTRLGMISEGMRYGIGYSI